MTARILVYTNSVTGRRDEFNDWYDNTHLPQILSLPMIVSAQRFHLQATGIDGSAAGSKVDMSAALPHEYLAVYEVTGDPIAAVQAITDGCADGSITLHEAFDVANTLSIIAEPHSTAPTA